MSDQEIIWNGTNTDEVVRFCYDWTTDYCSYHREFTNLLTGERTLEIEPGDTMRGYSLDVPIGSKCIRREKNYHRWIEVQ